MKILVLDVDGVVIETRKKYFSDRLVDEFGVSPENAKEFVANALKPAMIGQADIRDALSDYIQQWKLNITVDELLEYWWSHEKELNREVLDVVAGLKEKGMKCYLASDQEKYRGEYLMNEMGFAELFDGAYMSFLLGVQKHDQEFFQLILEDLQITDPTEIIFWDDDEKNVAVAKSVGIDAYYFESTEQFKDKMQLIAA